MRCLATPRSVAPLAYNAEECVLIARCVYSDRENNDVTQLVAVDTRLGHVIGFVGNPIVGVSSVAVEFVRNTGLLLVALSSMDDPTSVKGTAV